MSDRLATKFHLLRARIESDVKQPGVVMITSAQRHDGKSFTAYGLAECLASVGHRTALVDANAEGRGTTQVRGTKDPRRGLSIFGMPTDESGPSSSRESICNFVTQMRTRFDFTIVDGAPLLRSGAAILLASAVDGVLLTVRVGRAPCEEDTLTVRMLKQTRSAVLGIVAASNEGIAQFERTRESLYSEDPRVILLEPQSTDSLGDGRLGGVAMPLSLRGL
jgi:Mrp family chromosome partitioning ATPase